MAITTVQRTLNEETFEEVAIQRLLEHEPQDGYYLAFSGGKDSVVIYDLAIRSGVKFDAHFSRTTVDPPEVTQFIKEYYPDVVWEKPKMSMFRLIRKEMCLPTRHKRFCCRALKEIGGAGRTVITGIRAQESHARKNRVVFSESKRHKGKFLLHPIFYWSDEDVWNYIRSRGLLHCSLYDEGKKRIGCIMCPLQSRKGMEWDASRFPKFYQAYLRAIRFLYEHGKYSDFESPEEVMDWWMQKIKTKPMMRTINTGWFKDENINK